jgi:hypothetical protein
VLSGVVGRRFWFADDSFDDLTDRWSGAEDQLLSGCQKASGRWLLHQSIMPPALFTLYVLAGCG